MNHHSSDGIAPVSLDPFDRFAADPFASPAPGAGEPNPPAQTRQHGWWRPLLMCPPMLAVVAFLVATWAAGSGAIGYSVLCMAMMGAMMLLMNHGSRGGARH